MCRRVLRRTTSTRASECWPPQHAATCAGRPAERRARTINITMAFYATPVLMCPQRTQKKGQLLRGLRDADLHSSSTSEPTTRRHLSGRRVGQTCCLYLCIACDTCLVCRAGARSIARFYSVAFAWRAANSAAAQMIDELLSRVSSAAAAM